MITHEKLEKDLKEIEEETLDVLDGKKKYKAISIILCIFLGYFGLHRFYIGKPLSAGFMCLLTLFSIITHWITLIIVLIWAFIDLVRICTNTLKPESGHY